MVDMDMLELEIQMLKEDNERLKKDVEIQKDIGLELRQFRREFVKENGYVPKIVKKVRENVKKDLAVIEKNILGRIDIIDNKISKFACQNPSQASEELMKASGCKIVDADDKLYPGEKAI
jgi:hypothetical protein